MNGNQSKGRRNQKSIVDPATKLMVKMAIPLDGKRTFFVSKGMAETFRRQSVLQRREEILHKRNSSSCGKGAFSWKDLISG
jgi:hypothetical protein